MKRNTRERDAQFEDAVSTPCAPLLEESETDHTGYHEGIVRFERQIGAMIVRHPRLCDDDVETALAVCAVRAARFEKTAPSSGLSPGSGGVDQAVACYLRP